MSPVNCISQLFPVLQLHYRLSQNIKMKLFVVVACLIASAVAAPTEIPPPPALDTPTAVGDLAALRALPALFHQEIHDEFGQYSLRYVTAEGTVVTERGRLVPTPSGDHVLVTEGEVSYTVGGVTYVTRYSSGLDGSHITGDHLPVPVEPIVVRHE